MLVSFVADHFQYLASIGPIALFAAGYELWARFAAEPQTAAADANAEVSHDRLPTVMADRSLMGSVLQNLITNASIFFAYVEGATDLKQVLVSPGASATVTVDNVADLGRLQYVYIKSGLGTWLFPQAYADVIPGRTVAAANPVQITSGFGPFKLYINNFTWKPDGSEIAYLVEAGFKEFLPSCNQRCYCYGTSEQNDKS